VLLVSAVVLDAFGKFITPLSFTKEDRKCCYEISHGLAPVANLVRCGNKELEKKTRLPRADPGTERARTPRHLRAPGALFLRRSTCGNHPRSDFHRAWRDFHENKTARLPHADPITSTEYARTLRHLQAPDARRRAEKITEQSR
jgi:hypothetical protein